MIDFSIALFIVTIHGVIKIDYKSKYEKLLQDSKEKDEEIKQLRHDNKMLYYCLQRLRDMASDMLENKAQKQKKRQKPA